MIERKRIMTYWTIIAMGYRVGYMIHHIPLQKNLCNLFGTKSSTKLRQLGEEGGLGRRTMSGSFSNRAKVDCKVISA